MKRTIPRLNYCCNIDEIIQHINFADMLYDIIRVVDPVTKTLILGGEGTPSEQESSCFSFWTVESACKNCISMRAYQSGKVMMKLEYGEDIINMITAVPVYIGEKLVVVELLKNITESMFLGDRSDDNTDTLKKVIDSIGDIAIKDSLTGVYNRRFIDEQLPNEVGNACRKGRQLSIVMSDIDNFKTINDTYCHRTGDEVLIAFAQLIMSCLRKNEDWLARFGGDEFLIMLPDSDGKSAAVIAERIRLAVESTPILCGDTQLNITASFGVYSIDPQSESNLDILDEADKQMYAAKQAGGNRVV